METAGVAKERRPNKSAKGIHPTLPKTVRARTAHQQGSRYAEIYRASPWERITWIRNGVPADGLVGTGEDMGFAKERMISLLNFARATVNRRIKTKEALPTEYSERVIGLQKLIGQVEVMVAESGDPAGFNAARWIADWLERPVAALGNARPADFMDTIEGQEMVSSLLAKMQSGAYA